eukprot:4895726-Amphidinium_carterae.1
MDAGCKLSQKVKPNTCAIFIPHYHHHHHHESHIPFPEHSQHDWVLLPINSLICQCFQSCHASSVLHQDEVFSKADVYFSPVASSTAPLLPKEACAAKEST